MKPGSGTYALAIGFVVLALGPMLLGLGYASLYSLGLIGRLSEGLSFEHWEAVLGSWDFYESLVFSLLMAVASIGISTLLALGLVSWLGDRMHQGVWALAGYLPLAFPAVVVAYLGFQWLSAGGLFSRLAYQLGMVEGTADFPELINDSLGLGILAAHVCMATPFLWVYFAALYRQEGVSALVRVSQTLGLGGWGQVWRVIAPVLLWRGRSTLILYGMFVVGSYEIPLLLGSQGRPMLSVLVVRKLSRFSLADIPQGYVMLVCYGCLVMLFLGLWRRR